MSRLSMLWSYLRARLRGRNGIIVAATSAAAIIVLFIVIISQASAPRRAPTVVAKLAVATATATATAVSTIPSVGDTGPTDRGASEAHRDAGAPPIAGALQRATARA